MRACAQPSGDDRADPILPADIEVVAVRDRLDIARAAGAGLELLGRIALGRFPANPLSLKGAN